MTEPVLITGASSGLGLAMALYLAERNLRVFATVRDPKRANPLLEAVAGRNLPINVLTLDVTKPSTIQGAVDEIRERCGGLFGLVNNAGVQMRGFFEDLTEAEMRGVFETNFFGTLAVTRAVLPVMRQSGRGRVLFLGSAGGRIGTMGSSAYCATKFALEGFAESLHQEVRPFGIHVSILEPGIVPTELFGRNRTIAAAARSAASPYCEYFRRLERITDRRVAGGPVRATDVARTAHKALTARRPRLRYVVGRSAKLLLLGKRFLPQGLFDQAVARRLWKLIESENEAG